MDLANIDEVRDNAFLRLELCRSNMCMSSLPYIVRFRQCVVEYTSPSNDSRRPLLNALKYASSFPVIYLSAAQRLVVSDLVAKKGEQAMEEAWHGEHALFRLWYVWSVFLLSSYNPSLFTLCWLNFQATLRPHQFFIFLLVGRDERPGLRSLAIHAKIETPPSGLLTSPTGPPCST